MVDCGNRRRASLHHPHASHYLEIPTTHRDLNSMFFEFNALLCYEQRKFVPGHVPSSAPECEAFQLLELIAVHL